ncbi:Hypothetical protein CINCED_3A011643, partial [Cinara cedri]
CEDRCIRPQDIGAREKFNIVSTQQKWVSSEIEVLAGMKVMGIDIVANELDFCTKQGELSKDVLVYPNPTQFSLDILYLPVELPFELRAGDTISFSIVENKICKNNNNGDKRPIKIDETCSEEETPYPVKILNQQDCDSQKCPNKYVLNKGRWLNGKEYWSDNMKEDEIRATKEEIEKTLRQNRVIDCSNLSNMVGKIDTYLLNLMNNKCNPKDSAQFESLINSQRLITDLEDALSNTSDGYAKLAEAITKFAETKKAETYIPLLGVYMNNENFNHIPGIILTNYGYEIKKDHSKGEKLFFNLGQGNSGKGGYNIRVQRNVNPNNKSINTNHVLYMHLKDIALDGNCYKTAEATDKNKVTPHAICKGGTFFCEDQDNKRVEIKLEPLEGQEQKYKVLVGNGYTPYDNKVHFNVNGKVQWISGSLLDLRRNKVGLDKADLGKLCAGEKDPKKKKECHDNEKKKYSSSELNCYYDRICYNKEGIGNCISSIRRKEYDVGGKCNMHPYLEELTQGSVGRENSWAEALVAKIASSDIDYSNTPYNSRADMDINAKGTQCLPEKNGLKGDNICSKISKHFEDFSLQLNCDYPVNNDVKPGSSVMLAIANNGNYDGHRGGYHVQ